MREYCDDIISGRAVRGSDIYNASNALEGYALQFSPDFLLGIARKGIFLVTPLAKGLYEHRGTNVRFGFDSKTTRDIQKYTTKVLPKINVVHELKLPEDMELTGKDISEFSREEAERLAKLHRKVKRILAEPGYGMCAASSVLYELYHSKGIDMKMVYEHSRNGEINVMGDISPEEDVVVSHNRGEEEAIVHGRIHPYDKLFLVDDIFGNGNSAVTVMRKLNYVDNPITVQGLFTSFLMDAGVTYLEPYFFSREDISKIKRFMEEVGITLQIEINRKSQQGIRGIVNKLKSFFC